MRATSVDALRHLPEDSPPAGASIHEGAFSVVERPAEGRVRPLPTLHFGKAPIFAARRLSTLASALDRALEMAVGAPEVPTYLMHACRIGDRTGLYMRDLLNRTAFRRRAARLGLEFAERPFVRLVDGAWSSLDWADFDPSFLIHRGRSEDPSEVIGRTGGLLLFQVATYRLGALPPIELPLLAAACAQLEAVGASEPQAIISTLASTD